MAISEGISFGLAFVAGFLTSAHCVGMCGGFIMAYTTAGTETQRKNPGRHAWYAIGKLISYGSIGAAFGFVGKSIAISTGVHVATAITAGILLIIYGLVSLKILPLQRVVAARTPRRVAKVLSDLKSRYSHPLVFGLLSGFMVICGPLQAMYVAAAGTGSVSQGAVLLLLFGAGTLPALVGFGMATGFLSYRFTVRALRVSGVVIILLGALMINRGVAVSSGKASCCRQHDTLSRVEVNPPLAEALIP